MSLLSGCSNNSFNCSTAFGDSLIGAFLGLSLLFFGLAAAVSGVIEGLAVCDVDVAPVVALLFCASTSPNATLGGLSFRCHGAVGGQVCCELPDMLVSETPLFFGGGGRSLSSVCGRCADSVIRGRLEDAARGRKDEKGHLWALRHCAHRRVAAGCAVKRKMVDTDGAAVRIAAMVGERIQRGEVCGEIVYGEMLDRVKVATGKLITVQDAAMTEGP